MLHRAYFTSCVLWTNSIKQSSSWDANSHSANQICRLLWKPVVYCRAHKTQQTWLFYFTWLITHNICFPLHFCASSLLGMTALKHNLSNKTGLNWLFLNTLFEWCTADRQHFRSPTGYRDCHVSQHCPHSVHNGCFFCIPPHSLFLRVPCLVMAWACTPVRFT
jgi:hypothetical protein